MPAARRSTTPTKQPILTGLEEVADFQIIREWEKTTEFGDRAEIKTLPETQHRLGQAGCARAICARARSASSSSAASSR